MNFNNRTYAIFNISELENINYSEVLQDSKDSVRKSNDDSLFILTWLNDAIPSFISNNSISSTWSGDHSQVLEKLNESNWAVDEEIFIGN
jgi:hypothetical protein